MTTTTKKYRVGSIIVYRTFTGATRTVTVEAKEADIKDGQPGFDGTDSNGTDVWGYDDQIIRVEKF